MTHAPNISVVDDDASARDGIKDLLTALGFEARGFPDAASFLESDDLEVTSCLIADVRMSGMTGIELAARLSASGSPIPTILITAFPNDSVRARANQASVVQLLSKPFSEDELLACIRSALQRSIAERSEARQFPKASPPSSADPEQAAPAQSDAGNASIAPGVGRRSPLWRAPVLLSMKLLRKIRTVGREWRTRLAFHAWKATSRKAHGGRRVKVNDVSIYFETFGQGPPVLVLHGGLGALNDMAWQIRDLARSHFVVAPDTRGHGRSTGAAAPLSYPLIADDMVKLLDHLNLDKVDVVGWSDGGVVALELGMNHPDRVRKIIPISANFDPDGVVWFAGRPVPRTPLRYRLYAPDARHWPTLYRNVTAMWRTQPRYTPGELRRIQAPALIMAGQFDTIKAEHTHRLAELISGSQEVIVEGATHLVPSDRPLVVNRRVAEFLAA